MPLYNNFQVYEQDFDYKLEINLTYYNRDNSFLDR